ncbi:MAG TPA: right-handed parallel beta-helix repeat-containing protein [Phycisphaerae bacterium]|nr:right-handed parallel beta-helix repeat-containing protein [Phycisphaerae bacterium]
MGYPINLRRPPSLIVAASNAPADLVSRADYVCDGTADDVQLQAAHDALLATGGEILLTPGQFNLSAPVLVSKPGVTIRGVGYGTILKLANAANCSAIATTVAGAEGFCLRDMKIDGNGANQTAPTYTTSVTGTDADPTVLTKAGAWTGLNLTGAYCYVGGRKVRTTSGGGYYCQIASNTDDTLTLDRNISSGGALSGLEVVVYKDGSYAGPLVRLHSSNVTHPYGEKALLTGLWLTGGADCGILLEACRRSKIHNVFVQLMTGHGIRSSNFHMEISACGIYSCSKYGHYADQIEDCSFVGTNFAYNTLGGLYSASGSFVSECHFYRNGYGIVSASTTSIVGCKFQGNTEDCINTPSATRIAACSFINNYKACVNNAADSQIVGNRFWSTVATANTYSEVVCNYRCQVVGNEFGVSSGNSMKRGVWFQVSNQGHRVESNYFNATYGTETISAPGASDVIRNNTGYVTENAGTATVASGQTSVTVNHGCALTPAHILVTPTNSLGNATKFYVSSITSTQFTVAVDQDPGATTATFAWSVRI